MASGSARSARSRRGPRPRVQAGDRRCVGRWTLARASSLRYRRRVPLVTRPARDSDRDGLIQLIGSAYAEYPGCVLDVEREEPDLLGIATAYARHRGEFWVTIDEASGALVASAGCLPSPAPEYRGWLQLRKLYVAKSQRRQGLASALLASVEQTARGRGAPGVELWSDTRFL